MSYRKRATVKKLSFSNKNLLTGSGSKVAYNSVAHANCLVRRQLTCVGPSSEDKFHNAY